MKSEHCVTSSNQSTKIANCLKIVYRERSLFINFFFAFYKIMKEELIKKIIELTNLKENWDGYGALPLDTNIATKLIYISSSFPSDFFDNADIYPNPHATLSIEWENKNNKLSLELGIDTMSYYAKDDSSVSFYDKRKYNLDSYIKLRKKLEKLNLY